MEHRLFHTLVIASALSFGACSGAEPRARTPAQAPAAATASTGSASGGASSGYGGGGSASSGYGGGSASSGYGGSASSGYGGGSSSGSGAAPAPASEASITSRGSGARSSGGASSSGTARAAQEPVAPTWILTTDADASSLLALRSCEVGWPTTKGGRRVPTECGVAQMPDGSSQELCCFTIASTPGADCCLAEGEQ